MLEFPAKVRLRTRDVFQLIRVGGEVRKKFPAAGRLKGLLPFSFADAEQILADAGKIVGALRSRGIEHAVALPLSRRLDAHDLGNGGAQIHVPPDRLESLTAGKKPWIPENQRHVHVLLMDRKTMPALTVRIAKRFAVITRDHYESIVRQSAVP